MFTHFCYCSICLMYYDRRAHAVQMQCGSVRILRAACRSLPSQLAMMDSGSKDFNLQSSRAELLKLKSLELLGRTGPTFNGALF